MWNTSISLPVMDSPTQDNSGFVTHNKTYIENIPASRKDTSRSDEELANQFGYTASQIYEMDVACYNGAGYLIDEEDDTVYDIKRTFHADKSNLISLTVEERQHGKV